MLHMTTTKETAEMLNARVQAGEAMVYGREPVAAVVWTADRGICVQIGRGPLAMFVRADRAWIASAVGPKPRKPSAPRATRPVLTAAQSKRVRELVEDEGQSRAEAVAWVLAFEPAEKKEMVAQ